MQSSTMNSSISSLEILLMNPYEKCWILGCYRKKVELSPDTKTDRCTGCRDIDADLSNVAYQHNISDNYKGASFNKKRSIDLHMSLRTR